MNEHLKLTPAGANLIKHFEGCLKPHQGKYKAYTCPAGVTTIGWGTTHEHGNKVTPDTVWTKEQCDAAFLRDMEKFEAYVRRLVRVPLTPWQYDALVSFVYNVGPGVMPPDKPQHGVGLSGSTLLKKLNAADYDGAAKEFLKWDKANGKKLAGLTRRRKSESLLFQNIPDENYDGLADKPHAEDHPMPQKVDSPED